MDRPVYFSCHKYIHVNDLYFSSNNTLSAFSNKQYCLQMIAKHRDDELEHREIGLKNDAENVRNISIPALLTQSVVFIAKCIHLVSQHHCRHLS